MIRLTFRIPADGNNMVRCSGTSCWQKRVTWVEKQAEDHGCFIDTDWADLWARVPDLDFVILIPDRQGPWCPDPTPELREWITELGFEVVENTNAN